MALIEIPCRTDLPHYNIGIDLENVSYVFEFYWNDRAAAWFFDLSLDSGAVLLSGRRVSVGIPLLYRFADARLPPGYLEAVDTTGQGVDPGLTELGGRVHLLYFDSTTTVADLA